MPIHKRIINKPRLQYGRGFRIYERYSGRISMNKGKQAHTYRKEDNMAKQGMKRPDKTKRPKNAQKPVPELQGKVKESNKKAKPIQDFD